MKQANASQTGGQNTLKSLIKQVAHLTKVMEQTTNKTNLDFDGWISNDRFMKQMNICSKTAYNWRCDGLPYIRKGRRIYYHELAIQSYLHKFNCNNYSRLD